MTKPGDSLTTKKTIHELVKEFPDKSYRELEIYRDADRREEAQRIITQQENEELKEDQEEDPDEVRYRINWKTQYEKEHKLRQEAEGELTILKGIETNRVKEYIKKNDELQNELDRIKKENNDLYNKIAKLTDPGQALKKTRESGW
jgi:hypothetical protein